MSVHFKRFSVVTLSALTLSVGAGAMNQKNQNQTTQQFVEEKKECKEEKKECKEDIKCEKKVEEKCNDQYNQLNQQFSQIKIEEKCKEDIKCEDKKVEEKCSNNQNQEQLECKKTLQIVGKGDCSEKDEQKIVEQGKEQLDQFYGQFANEQKQEDKHNQQLDQYFQEQKKATPIIVTVEEDTCPYSWVKNCKSQTWNKQYFKSHDRSLWKNDGSNPWLISLQSFDNCQYKSKKFRAKFASHTIYQTRFNGTHFGRGKWGWASSFVRASVRETLFDNVTFESIKADDAVFEDVYFNNVKFKSRSNLHRAIIVNSKGNMLRINASMACFLRHYYGKKGCKQGFTGSTDDLYTMLLPLR